MPGLGSCSLGEVIDAVAQAAQKMGNEPFPWNYAETNILVPAPYSTGTVSITNGTAALVGLGTVWDVSWYGRRIRFGNSNLDYTVSSINTPTSITLAQPVNLGASLVGASYVIYQDTYLYPDDYIFGSDVSLSQPLIRDRILKIPRYRFENVMNAWARSMSTNIQLFYCDHGLDLTTGTLTSRRYRFRLGPPPAGPVELRLCYHQIAPGFSPNELVTLPEGYDEILGLMAASDLYGSGKASGMGDEVKARAAGLIRLLKRQVATQTIDDVPDASSEVSDSSISQYGMMISRN